MAALSAVRKGENLAVWMVDLSAGKWAATMAVVKEMLWAVQREES